MYHGFDTKNQDLCFTLPRMFPLLYINSYPILTFMHLYLFSFFSFFFFFYDWFQERIGISIYY